MTDWAPPVLGFLVCFYIWLNLSMSAKQVGTAWLALGAIYGLSRGAFRRKAVGIPS